jgi:hypothetical protein
VVGILGLVSVFFFSAPEPTLSDPDAPAVTAPEAPAVRDVTAPDVPPAPGDSAAPAGDDALGDLIREQGQP